MLGGRYTLRGLRIRGAPYKAVRILQGGLAAVVGLAVDQRMEAARFLVTLIAISNNHRRKGTEGTTLVCPNTVVGNLLWRAVAQVVALEIAVLCIAPQGEVARVVLCVGVVLRGGFLSRGCVHNCGENRFSPAGASTICCPIGITKGPSQARFSRQLRGGDKVRLGSKAIGPRDRGGGALAASASRRLGPLRRSACLNGVALGAEGDPSLRGRGLALAHFAARGVVFGASFMTTCLAAFYGKAVV